MDESLCLPPGFRFHPTDEEIITHYLLEKIADRSFSSLAIAEANFNDCEPWDLPEKAKMGEKEWFFFCQKDRKYTTGTRTNRATESGYWKATGKDKEIFKGNKGMLVGNKKTLVFYMGRAPRGQKTNWVMHEYRLEGKHQRYLYSLSRSPQYMQDEWVVCKVYNKKRDTKISSARESAAMMNSYVDEFLVDNPTLPPLMDSPVQFNSSNKEVVGPQDQEDGFSQSIFYSPTNPRVHDLHQEGDIIRAPLISNQPLYALKVPGKIEQPLLNAEASSSFSDRHQVSSLHDYDGDPSSGLQALDFDSILKYGFV